MICKYYIVSIWIRVAMPYVPEYHTVHTTPHSTDARRITSYTYIPATV